MKRTYPILRGKKQIGSASVQREGLYYAIECRCQMPDGIPPRIEVRCGEAVCPLGLCVPKDSGFGISTRVAVKKLGEGELGFCVAEKPSRKGFPVEPVTYLRYLPNMRLVQIGNDICLQVDDQADGTVI